MTNEEFVTWKHSELTQARFKELEEIIDDITENWSRGNFSSEEEIRQRGVIAGLRMSMEEVE